MMKNLIIFHMESLSNSIFRLNPEFFPNLMKWSQHMETYTNYYSTATSTLMVITDLFFGNTQLFEESKYLEDLFDITPMKKSLFDYLYENGFKTCNFYYGMSAAENMDCARLQKLIAAQGQFWYGDCQELLREELCKKLNEEVPFAFFIEENASHIGYSGGRINKENKHGNQLYEERYNTIDKTISMIFSLLEEYKLLDNTVVLLYGDHGEEYWFHGLYEGYTHAIEPFTNMISCPLFIFDGNYSGRNNPQLLGTDDLYNLIEYKLGFVKEIERKQYVFSRNLFANQFKRASIFHKGYSVTDGEYTLLSTRKGLSMFSNKVDLFNQRNFLDFFELKNQNLFYRKEFDYMISTHYKYFMNEGQKKEIIDEFSFLMTGLKEKIYALPGTKSGCTINRIHYTHNKVSFYYRLLKNRIDVLLTDRK